MPSAGEQRPQSAPLWCLCPGTARPMGHGRWTGATPACVGPAERSSPPISSHAPPPALQNALCLWFVSGNLHWARQSREKGSAVCSAELCPACWCPACCPPPCLPLLPNAGRRTQQPLWADQPQPTGLYRSTGSFLGDVPVIPHLPASPADRIHHGNPWAAHSHLQLLRLRAHGPHTAGAAAPGLHSAPPASKDTCKPGGDVRLQPELSGQGLLGTVPRTVP